MRIVLISREHPDIPLGGGIGTYTVTMAQALARLGHDVAILTRGDHPERMEAGVRIVALHHQWVPHPVAERILSAWRVARAARRLRPDVIQAAEWEAEAWWLARRRPVPLFTRLATPTYLVEMLNAGAVAPPSALVRRMERLQAARSDALLAPSHAIARRVAPAWGLPLERIEVIPNPVDGEAVRRAAGAPPPVPLPDRFLAYIGRLERRKGIETLAAALPAALDAHPGVHAVLIGNDAGTGPGGYAAHIRRATEGYGDRVHLLGGLPRAEAMAVVGRSELVVLPSLWEAFGFVALEAMALGRPLIATGGSGFAEIVRDGESGRLVPPGDAEALAAALVDALGRPEALERLAREGRRRADDFEADRLAPRLVAAYERAIAQQPKDGAFDRSIYTGAYRRHFRPEERRGPFHRIYERKRDAVLAFYGARGPMALVDVGCGPGRLTAPLAATHRMTGCDISPQMLEEARRACPQGVRLVEADARALPFADGAFDGLVALDLLTHLPDLDAGIAELARVVAPGGPLVFDTSNASPWWVPAYPAYVAWRPRRLVATMRSDGVLPEWTALVSHHRAGEVREAIARAGLELHRVERFGPPWTAKWHLWYATRPAA